MTRLPRRLVSVLVAGTFVGTLARAAAGQVDCDVPEDLCAGDPCVVPNLLVGSPCIVDFGARALVIDGTLRLPPNGSLTLTAASIDVRGEIRNLPDGRNVGGTGPEVRLAAAGAIDVPGRLRLNGRLAGLGGTVPGLLELDAGGALTLGGTISASTGPTTLTLDAGGDVAIGRSVVARSPGDTLAVAAGDRVDLAGRLRVPTVDIDAAGDVSLGGTLGQLQAATIQCSGTLTVARPIRARGASLVLHGDAGVGVADRVDLSTLFTTDGGLEIVSTDGDIAIDDVMRASAITIVAAGAVDIRAFVATSSLARSAGPMTISGGTDVTIDAELAATGGDGTTPTDGAGGEVTITSGGLLSVTRGIRVNGFPGRAVPAGRVHLSGASVAVGPAASLDARGCRDAAPCNFFRPPGELRITSTAGNVTLDGSFAATGGATTIESMAAGDLTAVGEFTAGADGCIALAATGVLDTSGATLDGPLRADCP